MEIDSLLAGRYERFRSGDRADDQRDPAQRDRDRILYTTALRRLAGITQVVAPTERYVLHNRLTHTLEVAQIGRRLAERLLAEPGGEERASAAGGLHPETVEAAALAHDLGHPPFGHIAEQELDDLVKANDMDGFNGNAQTFRIVTKLAVRHGDFAGLNLTRATLNAILKYPWLRATSGEHQHKWGAYHTEHEEFEWARQTAGPIGRQRSLEAELMDWADDVAYAVHDVEDFYRARLIPLDRLVKDPDEVERFLQASLNRLDGQLTEDEWRQRKEVFAALVEVLPTFEPYEGRRDQRATLRAATAHLIADYVHAVSIEPGSESSSWVRINSRARCEVSMLKQLTWHYVIDHPSLATRQHGQREVIRRLFAILAHAATSRPHWLLFPLGCREQLQEVSTDTERVRVVVDLLASMTEGQCLEMYRTLTGMPTGSSLEALII